MKLCVKYSKKQTQGVELRIVQNILRLLYRFKYEENVYQELFIIKKYQNTFIYEK